MMVFCNTHPHEHTHTDTNTHTHTHTYTPTHTHTHTDCGVINTAVSPDIQNNYLHLSTIFPPTLINEVLAWSTKTLILRRSYTSTTTVVIFLDF